MNSKIASAAICVVALFASQGIASAHTTRHVGMFSSSELNEAPTGGVIADHCRLVHGQPSAGCSFNTNTVRGEFSSSERSEPPWGGVIPGNCSKASSGCTPDTNGGMAKFSSSEMNEPPWGGVIPGQ